MTAFLPRIALIVAVWMVLWRDVSGANLVSGIVVAVGLTWMFRFSATRTPRTIRPLPALRFLGEFVWSVAKANLFVAWEVLTPTNSIREGVIAVELGTDDPVLVTIISHAIGLAPGTMVIDIQNNPTIIYVHALHMASFEAEREAVYRLERLVRAAFDPGYDLQEVV